MNIDFQGGNVRWNNFEEINSDNECTLSQDMLWVQYEKFHLDVGWYENTYIVYILECDDFGNGNWKDPLEKSFVQNENDLEYKINTTINYWKKLL